MKCKYVSFLSSGTLQEKELLKRGSNSCESLNWQLNYNAPVYLAVDTISSLGCCTVEGLMAKSG